jgi:hypothetical protein
MTNPVVPIAAAGLLGVFAGGMSPSATAASPAVKVDPLRQAYFGDLHLHTSYSLDGYLGGVLHVDPDMAYRFARGDVVTYFGQPLQRRPALDFLAVTDHAENLGVMSELNDPASALSRSAEGKGLRAVVDAMTRPDGRVDVEHLLDKPKELSALYTLSQDFGWGRKNRLPGALKPATDAAWARVIEAANRNDVPGRFTAFIGYEWTGAAHGGNLHRNVIFRGDTAPKPFTAWDSNSPEDLWDWLDTIRARGFEALAIPHNSNSSDGLMFGWLDSFAAYLDRAYAMQRQANEPLAEISQNKGASEAHPLLSPNDELADYEIYDSMAGDRRSEGRLPGSYLRDALGRGLVLQEELGVNPFKVGFAGGSDLHSGLSVSTQRDYGGSYYQPNIGPGRPSRAEATSILVPGSARVEETRQTTSGNLTGAWAESNTRDSIYAALRRRETFATTGTRLKIRFFGGWNFSQSTLAERNWIAAAYRDGVPMGSDLAAVPANAQAPAFVAWVSKDPDGANLDRLQVIKVWLDGRQQREQVFDVAWAGARRPDVVTGKLPAVGNTVNLQTGEFTNVIGAAELKVVWQDPAFDPRQPAAYYVRAVEIPTPRWTTLLAVQSGVPLPPDVPATIQQRGWSSPIWYSPETVPVLRFP